MRGVANPPYSAKSLLYCISNTLRPSWWRFMTSLACCGGVVDKGTAEGLEEVWDGISCYVAPTAYITNTQVAVIIATDIFGYKLPNARLIADKFSKELGVLAVVPDSLQGNEPPADLMTSFETLSETQASVFAKSYAAMRLAWYATPFLLHNGPAGTVQKLERIVTYLRTHRGIAKIAMQGYCWGGRAAVLLAQKKSVVDVICAAHPGGLKIPRDIELIQQPVLFILPEKDFEIKAPQVKEIEDTLQRQGGVHAVKFYAGMQHGFAVRGSEEDEEVCSARKDAFMTAAAFFKDVLAL
ncbi:hypothetical protein EON64_15910 [archaeon]|nr:MAG: hypothetical protein EON64_15910 [archaeon]